jgi:hypothetical protein
MLAAIIAPVLVCVPGSFAENIEPSRRQMIAGIEKVSTTCSGRR